MIPFPNMNAPFVARNGRIQTPWNSYLLQFTQAPASLIDVTVGASPFSYLGREPGTLVIEGGTISAITLTRGADILTLAATNNLIPISINDTVEITYSVLPTIKFLPALGVAVR